MTIGGLGSAVADVIAEQGIRCRLIKVGIKDTFTHGASKLYLMKKYGLDAMTLIKAVDTLTGKSFGIKEIELEKVRLVNYNHFRNPCTTSKP